MKAILGILVVSLLGSAALAYGLSSEFLFKFDSNNSPLHSTATNSSHIFVADTGTDQVEIFDLSGNSVDFFPVTNPRGIAVNDTRIFVSKENGDVDLFYLSGIFNMTLSSGYLTDPRGITVNDTHALVTDTGTDRVESINLSTLIPTPFGAAELGDPTDVTIDSNGRIIVSDSVDDRIEIFDDLGNHLSSFGSTGVGDGQFNFPSGVDVDSNNRIIVSDTINLDVQIFDASGNFLTTFGSSGTNDGEFSNPSSVTVDTSDRIIVSDSNGASSRIQVFAYTAASSTGDGGGDGKKHKTAPTSGLDWTTHKQIVTDGFRVNDFTVTIDDNWWTNFPEQRIMLMMPNEFEIKTYAQNGGLLVQELCFGLAEVGLVNTAEVCLEAWYDHQQNIVELKIIQETDVIDTDQVNATTSEKKCSESGDMKCTSTLFHNVKFKEPMRYNIMAIKSVDQSRRSLMPTSLNDGIDLIGVSINPKPTMTIPGTEKYEGLITITQIEKYSNLWISDDGRIFYVNSSGSASIVNEDYTRHRDTDAFYMDRNHSEFDKLIDWTQQNAINVYDSSKFQKADKGFMQLWN